MRFFMSLNRFSLGSLLSTTTVVASLAASLSLVQVTAQSASAQTVVFGGGASFPSLLYRQWFDCYGVDVNTCPSGTTSPTTTNLQLLYASVGSGAGIRSFLDSPDTLSGDPVTYSNRGFSNSDGTTAPASSSPQFTASGFNSYPYPRVDIAGTDANLSTSQIDLYNTTIASTRGELLQLPTVAGAIAVSYNPTGLRTINSSTPVRLNRQALCGIFSGRITNWNNTTISQGNNGTQVSANLPIRVVRRSDSSGTTDNLTSHLNLRSGQSNALCASPNNWTLGQGTTVAWPASFLSASGSSAVVSLTSATTGAITYVSSSFVAPFVSGGLPSTRLQNQYALNNQVNQYVGPNASATSISISGISVPANPDAADFGTLSSQTVNPNRNGAYPIVGITYLLAYSDYSGAPSGVGSSIRRLFDYVSTTQAESLAGGLGFVPMPNNIQSAAAVAADGITP